MDRNGRHRRRRPQHDATSHSRLTAACARARSSRRRGALNCLSGKSETCMRTQRLTWSVGGSFRRKQVSDISLACALTMAAAASVRPSWILTQALAPPSPRPAEDTYLWAPLASTPTPTIRGLYGRFSMAFPVRGMSRTSGWPKTAALERPPNRQIQVRPRSSSRFRNAESSRLFRHATGSAFWQTRGPSSPEKSARRTPAHAGRQRRSRLRHHATN